MAKGLELCEANFIWAMRFPITDKTLSVAEVLPEGFLERTSERGRVVNWWVEQAKILGHPSTAAFVSHCGWSSLNESMYYGVSVVGMPMRLNMAIDTKMLVHAGACVEVGRGEDGAFMGDEIGKTINSVVGVGGEEVRRIARELSEKMREEEAEGREIDEAAQLLRQLCSPT